jgi:FdhE protein
MPPMVYVPIERARRDARLAAASSRWDAIAVRQPELEPAVAVQRQLVTLEMDGADAVARAGLPRLSLPPKYLAAKLARGVPALSGEPIPIPVPALAPTLIGVCRVLAVGGAGRAAEHICQALETDQIHAGFLLSSSLARDQEAIRTGAEHRGLAPDLLWLIAELGAAPFAYALQDRLFAPVVNDNAFTAAADGWRYGYCPACGSWPAVAELVSDRQVLRCSFCALAWAMPGGGCIYCGESGERFAVSFPVPAHPDQRIETCRNCKGYLKVVEVRTLSPFPLVTISDLETTGLDVAAMQLGFIRPSLKGVPSPR